jgi:N-acetylneuraminic acid mutarotase
MRKIVLKFFCALPFLLLLLIVPSCSDDSSEDLVGNWVEKGSFSGPARSNAISFTIGNKAYIVSGYSNYYRERLRDTWEFDPSTQVWTQKDSLPDGCLGRTAGVGFSANGKGYICTGTDDNGNKLKDVWEFDPTAGEKGTWTKMAEDFGGGARYGATAFSVGNKGYVLGGYNGNYLKDFWEFDPTTKSWKNLDNFTGQKRCYGSAFVINDTAYVVGGSNNGTNVEDFYAYDANTNTWIHKRDIADNSEDETYDDDYTSIARQDAATFVINGRGYLATGYYSGYTSKVWEYDPTTDLWEQKTSFEGSSRGNAVGITVQNRGFILTGKSSSSDYDDTWEFEPFADYDDKD